MLSGLDVLGSCGGWPEPDRACSGFLLEHLDYRVVLDLGYGTLPRLLSLLNSRSGEGVDAVVITHAHPDHMVDLHGLFRARWFGEADGGPIPLFASIEVIEFLRSLEDQGDEHRIEKVFDWHPLPTAAVTLGPFQMTSIMLPHYVASSGIRLASPELTVAYTSDTGPSPELARLGKDADLFIVDSTNRYQREGDPGDASAALLLNAREAGRVAHEASTRALLLTHFWPGNDREKAYADARAEYGGPLFVADEGLRIPLLAGMPGAPGAY